MDPRWRAKRHSGVSTREPYRIRNTDASGIGGTCAAACRRQPADPQALDSPRIGIQHFKFDAQWVSDDLAALRHSSGKARDEAAQGIHFFLVSVRAQPGALMLLEHLYRGACVGNQAPVAAL